jgi:hypothetical protein
VGDTGPLRSSAAREAVVRPLARAAERPCVRPGCPAPAQASLTFRYGSREAWVERLTSEPSPEAYDLCGPHAARTRPPHGWQLRDRRPREEQVEAPAEPEPRRDLGGEDTVAVLAAALRAVPEVPEAVERADEADPADATTGEGAGTTAPENEPGADGGALLEDDPSPVLEQPHVPPSLPFDAPSDAPAVTPRPVPAARDRGIEPPVDRSPRVPHGTARDW